MAKIPMAPVTKAAKSIPKDMDQRCEDLKKYLNDRSTPNTMGKVREIIKGQDKKKK